MKDQRAWLTIEGADRVIERQNIRRRVLIAPWPRRLMRKRGGKARCNRIPSHPRPSLLDVRFGFRDERIANP